eukprot:TRINITY_DN1121_c0_g1_i1.p1 TRINITY_DN1121_c0_g1~~TRINITY_DN1121_c0_g1_i1.p1  ORF type:complete len:743 (-),score=226.53 TRINITY_DN1121_c0_g1_i1:1396-3624(-)
MVCRFLRTVYVYLAAAVCTVSFEITTNDPGAILLSLQFDDVSIDGALLELCAGFDWTNWAQVAPSNATLPSYYRHVVSPPGVAYNVFGLPATVNFGSSVCFNFSGYFGAAWRNGLRMTVSASQAGTVVHQAGYELNTSATLLVRLPPICADQLTMATANGTPAAGLAQNTSQLVSDSWSFAFNACPRPRCPSAPGFVGVVRNFCNNSVHCNASGCVPWTCAETGGCGSVLDGCGGYVQCECAPGSTCLPNGVCRQCATCATVGGGGRCGGPYDDGCGSSLSCSCTEPGWACSAQGYCVACVTESCDALGRSCGEIFSCVLGQPVMCGTCPEPLTCSANGVCLSTTPTTGAATGQLSGQVLPPPPAPPPAATDTKPEIWAPMVVIAVLVLLSVALRMLHLRSTRRAAVSQAAAAASASPGAVSTVLGLQPPSAEPVVLPASELTACTFCWSRQAEILLLPCHHGALLCWTCIHAGKYTCLKCHPDAPALDLALLAKRDAAAAAAAQSATAVDAAAELGSAPALDSSAELATRPEPPNVDPLPQPEQQQHQQQPPPPEEQPTEQTQQQETPPQPESAESLQQAPRRFRLPPLELQRPQLQQPPLTQQPPALPQQEEEAQPEEPPQEQQQPEPAAQPPQHLHEQPQAPAAQPAEHDQQPSAAADQQPAAAQPQPPQPAKQPARQHQLPMCVVCLERPSNVLFVPCGHLCCCSGCGSKVTPRCPLCNTTFASKHQIQDGLRGSQQL